MMFDLLIIIFVNFMLLCMPSGINIIIIIIIIIIIKTGLLVNFI